MNSEALSTARGYRVGIGFLQPASGERIALPFRRSGIAILIAAIAMLMMSIPAFSTFADAARAWGSLESLFDLTSALFLTGWLLGWSVGLLFLCAILAVLVTGGESLILRPGVVEVRIGLPFLFVRAELDPREIRRLEHRVPQPEHGTSWRGPHLAFEYNGIPHQLGSAISPADADELARKICSVPPAPAGKPGISGVIGPDQAPASRRAATGVGRGTGIDETGGPGSLATVTLLAANLVPVVGVLLQGWDLGMLMVLFWAESGIIGFYNLCKMAVVQRWLVLLTGPVFVGHFGVFMSVHFLFVYELFVSRENHIGDSLTEVGQYLTELWPALLALLLSHGLSFIINFLGRREYRHKNAKEQMQEPYGRIVIMHLTVIFGGGLALVFGSPLPALLLLVALKVAADLGAHWKQRGTA